MERIDLLTTEIEIAAQKAAAVMRRGGVVLYPTDTLYGLGVDAFSNSAVDSVYALKEREKKKPIHCIVADMEAARTYAEFNEFAEKLAAEFWPGPLTLVLKKKEGVNTGIAADIGTIGIRIPDSEFCLALAREFGKPYTTTSANIAGEVSLRNVDAILEQLHQPEIDLIVDEGELPFRAPSTIVDVSGEAPVVLRKGGLDEGQISDILESERQ